MDHLITILCVNVYKSCKWSTSLQNTTNVFFWGLFVLAAYFIYELMKRLMSNYHKAYFYYYTKVSFI